MYLQQEHQADARYSEVAEKSQAVSVRGETVRLLAGKAVEQIRGADRLGGKVEGACHQVGSRGVWGTQEEEVYKFR